MSVPDGWKLVPEKITQAMQHAYFDEIDRNMRRVETDAAFGRFSNNAVAYAAMLAASPPPPIPHAMGEGAVAWVCDGCDWLTKDDPETDRAAITEKGFRSCCPDRHMRALVYATQPKALTISEKAVEKIVRKHFYPGPVAGSTARLVKALTAALSHDGEG